MRTGHIEEATTTRAAVRRARVARWCVTAAVVLIAIGVWNVGVWVNHWYIAENFFRPYGDYAAAKSGPTWDMWVLLQTGNVALVQGVVSLLVASALVIAGVLLRRTASPRRRTRSA